MGRIALVSGSSNKELSQKISELLDVPLVDPQIVRFANGEIFCEIENNVRGSDVFVLQSLTSPVNDHLMELLIMIDALKRASANSITAVLPHYAYARQDRKINPRTPISAKLVADLLHAAGATRVTTMDLHAGQIQGFFNIPFDNIYASPVILKYIRDHLMSDNTIFISPDTGGIERVRYYAQKCKKDLAMINKRRTDKNKAKAINIVGHVEGKECIIIDDMIDTAGTLVEACQSLKTHGATKIYACATHALFSPPALDRITSTDCLDKVIVTDTILLDLNASQKDKIVVLSVSDILSKAIHRTLSHDSLSSLFV